MRTMFVVRCKSCRRSGFTLLESLLAMSILAFAAAGVLLPFASGASIRAEAARITLASQLAGDLLEEISESASGPAVWDGFSESEAMMTDYSGNFLTDGTYAGLSRVVSSQAATVGGVVNYWVTVTVKYQGNDVVSLSRLIGG